MIITCPSCATSYEVAAAVLGSRGKAVRCASCGYTWHQRARSAGAAIAAPEVTAEPPPAPEPQPAPEMVEPPPEPAPEPEAELEPEPEPEPEEELPSDEEIAAALDAAEGPEVTSAEPESGQPGELDEEALAALPDPEPVESLAPEEAAEDEEAMEPELIPDPEPIPAALADFGDEDEEEEDRRRGRRTMWISIAAALVIIVALGGAAPFTMRPLIDSWPMVARMYVAVGLIQPEIGDGLEIRRTKLSRETENDEDVVIVRGIIVNKTDGDLTVPHIIVKLLDGNGVAVEAVTMPPLKSVLGPAEEIGFRAKLKDVPTARKIRVRFTEAAPAAGADSEDARRMANGTPKDAAAGH